MSGVYIVSAVRSPLGKRSGGLSDIHPADLLGTVMKEAVSRAGVQPVDIGDVIAGCVNQVGAQAGNVGRYAWLAAGLPHEVPAVTLDRQCGSSQQAVHFGVQGIQSGVHDLVVAAGVEMMSLTGLGAAVSLGQAAEMGGPRTSRGWAERYGDQEVSQFRGADLIAERWRISRADMERLSLESHRRAVAAMDAGRFAAEILAINGVDTDEGPRRSSDPAKMAGLKPVRQGGTITAALASQISDGAAAIVLASEQAVQRHGLKPLARVAEQAVVGSDPITMLTGPIPATAQLLHRAQLRAGDIDSWEVNEAFASVVLAWQQETGADLETVNPDGGAMALGHPVGASGARIMTTLAHRIARGDARRGVQVMCEGGGTANATLLVAV